MTFGIYDFAKDVTTVTVLQKVGAPGIAKAMSVNPEFTTVAICTEDIGKRTSTILVWPSGKFKHEQPLILSLDVGESPEPHKYFLMLSRGQPWQALHCGLPDGRIFCWHFNSTRSQIDREEQLMAKGTFLDVSSDGQW